MGDYTEEMPFGELNDEDEDKDTEQKKEEAKVDIRPTGPSIESLFDTAVSQTAEEIKEEKSEEKEEIGTEERDESLGKKIDELTAEITRFKRDNDIFINHVESTMAELMKSNVSGLQNKVEQQIRAIAQVQDAVVNRMAEVQSAGTQQQIELLKSELLDMREQIEQFILSEQYLEENLDNAVNDAVGRNVAKISGDLEKSYQTADKIGETIQKLGKAFNRTMSGMEWRVGAKSRIERNLLYIMGGASVANLVLMWMFHGDGSAVQNQMMGFIVLICIGLPLLLDIIFWRKK